VGKQELDNLVKIGSLKAEAATRKEFSGMVTSARRSLADAQNESIETDSQFDLAYGAAHRLALAALRHQGYRSENRITVAPFQITDYGDSADYGEITVTVHSTKASLFDHLVSKRE
jgi:hypothetical protein